MRKMSKGGSGGGGGDSWLNTYADMVTLLLTFFILLFTMSSVDAEKWKILVKAFGSSNAQESQIVLVEVDKGSGLITDSGDAMPDLSELPEIIEPIDFDQLYEYIKKYLTDNNLDSTVELKRGKNSVFIRFQDNVFFAPDKSVLRNEAVPLLDFLGDCFLTVNDQILSIRINGHTATVPGTVKKSGFDRTLSTERANSVLLYFEENKGIEPKKLVSIGYGRNYPVAGNDTEEDRKKNRRVELMILSTDFDLSSESALFQYMTGLSDADILDDDQNRHEILIPQVESDKEIYKNVSPYDD